jgi:hypothetical protein
VCLFQDRQHLLQCSLDDDDAHVRCFFNLRRRRSTK